MMSVTDAPHNHIAKNSNPAMNLSVGQVKEFYTAFKLFDRDGNGNISADELNTVMHSMGLYPTRAELRELMDSVDTDKSSSIGFKEFCTVLSSYGVHKPTPDEEKRELIEAFRVFDRINSGYINASDLRFIMGNLELDDNLTDGEIFEMISEVDTDGDGRISYEEFVAAMCEETNESDETVEQLINKLDKESAVTVEDSNSAESSVVPLLDTDCCF